MAIMISNTKPHTIMNGSEKLKKVYQGDQKLWSSGNIVTYHHNGSTTSIEYEEGKSVLSPTGFTPTLSGATFKGWSLSASAATVQTSLVMADSPIDLYAVFTYNDITVCAGAGCSAEGQGGDIYSNVSRSIDLTKHSTLYVYVSATFTGSFRGEYDCIKAYIDGGLASTLLAETWVGGSNTYSGSTTVSENIAISNYSENHTVKVELKSHTASSTYSGSHVGYVTMVLKGGLTVVKG